MDYNDMDAMAEKLSGWMDDSMGQKVNSDFMENYIRFQRLSEVLSKDREDIPFIYFLNDIAFLLGEEKAARIKAMVRIFEIKEEMEKAKDKRSFSEDILLKKEAMCTLMPFIGDENQKTIAVMMKVMEIREILGE